MYDKLDIVHTGMRTTPLDAADRSGDAGGWQLALCEGAGRDERRIWRKLRDRVFASEAEAREAIATERARQ